MPKIKLEVNQSTGVPEFNPTKQPIGEDEEPPVGYQREKAPYPEISAVIRVRIPFKKTEQPDEDDEDVQPKVESVEPEGPPEELPIEDRCLAVNSSHNGMHLWVIN